MRSLNIVAACPLVVAVDVALTGANLEVEEPSFEEESEAVDTQQAYDSGGSCTTMRSAFDRIPHPNSLSKIRPYSAVKGCRLSSRIGLQKSNEKQPIPRGDTADFQPY